MYAGIFCPEASENHLLHGDAGALGYPVECWGDFARLCTLLSHLLPGMLKCRDMCTGNVSKLNHVWLHLASLGHPLDPNMRTLEKSVANGSQKLKFVDSVKMCVSSLKMQYFICLGRQVCSKWGPLGHSWGIRKEVPGPLFSIDIHV